MAGVEINGKFYKQEIQPITQKPDDIYVVERVIKTRRRGKRTEYFVKWKNYLDKFNSWVNSWADNISTING